jgi:hypothetical protein
MTLLRPTLKGRANDEERDHVAVAIGPHWRAPRHGSSVSFTTSYTWVTLNELNRHFRGDALIPVSRKWLTQNNLSGRPIEMNHATLQASGNQPLVEEIKITEIE